MSDIVDCLKKAELERNAVSNAAIGGFIGGALLGTVPVLVILAVANPSNVVYAAIASPFIAGGIGGGAMVVDEAEKCRKK